MKIKPRQIRRYELKQILIFTIILFAALFVQAKSASADTHYVCGGTAECAGQAGWGAGINVGDCTDKSNPCETIQYGIERMSGGDTLIIGDGTYTGEDNMIKTFNGDIVRIPEGSEIIGYTKIHAENDGGVTIDGEGDRVPIRIRGDNIFNGTGTSPSHDYIELKGLMAINSSSSCVITTYVDHIKLINIGGADAADGNNSVFNLSRSSDILAEGIYAWGSGRYKVSTYLSDKVVIRNCITRHDRVNVGGGTNPTGGVVIYSSTNVEVQNCIDLDGGPRTYWDGNISGYIGSFGAPTTSLTETVITEEDPDTGDIIIIYVPPIYFTNVIALNNNIRFGSLEGNEYPANTNFNNCAGWDIETIASTDFIHSQGNSKFNQCTFGEVDNENQDVTFSYYNGWGSGVNDSSTNNIWYNFQNGGLFYDVETSNYNNIFGLDAGESIDVSGTTSNNTIDSIDPTQNSLLYLPRIEAGSDLANAGEGGARVGAEIIKMYGRPGTMWGEAGYDQLQDGTNGQDDIDLWPFPNEDLIKEKMQAYSYDNGNLTGNRGFCAYNSPFGSPSTLTSYIWEYLGNEIPCDIYGICEAPPNANFTASAQTISQGESVTFHDTSGNSPTSWSWTFEGGTPSNSTAEDPEVTYNSIGTYTVTLQAFNAYGDDTETKTGYITVVEPDLTPPADINDLAVVSCTYDSCTLTWTAPGDDGTSGTASSYDIRYSINPITDQTSWDAASQADGEPAPQAAGNGETFTVTELNSEETYYFVIKSSDDAIPTPNQSGLSNNPITGTTLTAIIIDNSDSASAFTTTGTDWAASGGSGYYGTDSIYSNLAGDTASWTIDIPESGQYAISAWWTYYNTRDDDVSYRIYQEGALIDTIVVNQSLSENGGRWNLLGEYGFSAEETVIVEVFVDGDNNSSTSADAVSFGLISSGGDTTPPSVPANLKVISR